MPIASGETQLKNASLDVFLLPKGSRTLTPVVITLGGAVAEGDTSVTISPGSTVNLKAGNSLAFLDGTRRKQILINEDVALSGSTAVACFAAVEVINSGATATFYDGLLPVGGIQSFNFQTSPQEVDTTNTLSGYGMESALVRSNLTIDIQGIQIPNNKGFYDVIKKVADSGAFFGREIFAMFTYPDGEQRYGAAKVKNYSEPGNQNEVKKYSFQLQFQGSSYNRLTPYIYS